MRIALAIAACALAAAQTPRTVSISSDRLSSTPVDPRIYGVLLEHIGRQMDTMWAELLQDNSFEGLREFSEQTLRWSEGPIDSSRFWWHSGYELHPWRSFGAGVSTAFANNIRHGMRAKTIANRSDQPAGIAQDGIPVRAGMTYHFSGYLSPGTRGGSAPVRVTLGLYADAAMQHAYDTAAMDVETLGYRKYTADLRVPETNGNATFAISAGRGFAAVDLVSLIPADNRSGWRADVVAALRAMGLKSFRYPGGCFASFVDWETMIGPPESRLPFTNPFWGGLEPNHAGTDEFLRLMELVEGEPLLEVNLISGTPESAAHWVEYCNGAGNTPYGRKRALNGHAKPYGVTYWELDNEVQRRFSAEQYAAECRRYSVAMKAVDPGIKLMAVGYFWNDDDLRTLVEKAGSAIDFLAVRTVDHAELAKLEALADRYSTPGHRLLIASTEWRNKWRKDPWAPAQIDGSTRRAEMGWGHAIECARTLEEFQRHSDHVRLAMFPTVTNLYGEDLMQIGKSKITFTPNGQVIAFLSDMRGVPLRVSAKAERVEISALLEESSRRVVCALVHGGGTAQAISLQVPWQIRGRPQARTLAAATGHAADLPIGEHAPFMLELPAQSVTKVIFQLP